MSTDALTIRIDDVQGIFDGPKFARLAQDLAPTHRTAAPFPSIIIDDFIDPTIACALSVAVPGPNDIDCPPDKYRKVLNLYYYTSRRDDGDMDDPHFTLYKPEASEFAMQLRADYRDSAAG